MMIDHSLLVLLIPFTYPATFLVTVTMARRGKMIQSELGITKTKMASSVKFLTAAEVKSWLYQM